MRERGRASVGWCATVAIAACVAGLAGCGGNDEGDAATTGEADAVSPDVSLKQAVRVADPEKPATFRRQVEARAGDVVQITTEVRGQPPSGGRIRISVPKGPAEAIEASAGPVGREPTAESAITAGRGEIELTGLRYVCRVPPDTFCPVETVTEGSDAFELILDVPPKRAPVLLTFDVVRGG